MIEVNAFERAEIRYIKFGRRIVRDAGLKDFLEFHLDTIIEQYTPMLALSDEQIADDQIGGRVGLELYEAPFQKQRGPLYLLHRWQFLKRHDAYEILVEMRRRIITSRNSLWRAIATLAFHKAHASLAVTNSMRAMGRDYQVIVMFTIAIREYTARHPGVARALYVSNRRTNLLLPRLLQIQELDEKDEPASAVEAHDDESAADVNIDELFKTVGMEFEPAQQVDIDNPIGMWELQRKHMWRDCSLVAPLGMLHPTGMEGVIEKFIYTMENIAHSPYAIRYTWEIFGGDEIVSAKSLHAELSGDSRLFEFGTSGAYLTIDRDHNRFFSELKYDSVAARLIYGEEMPGDAEDALQHFLKSVSTALAQAAGKVTLGLPQERRLDQVRDLTSGQSFRRHWVNLQDVTGEGQMQLIFLGEFLGGN